jgi:hypothetical protein
VIRIWWLDERTCDIEPIIVPQADLEYGIEVLQAGVDTEAHLGLPIHWYIVRRNSQRVHWSKFTLQRPEAVRMFKNMLTDKSELKRLKRLINEIDNSPEAVEITIETALSQSKVDFSDVRGPELHILGAKGEVAVIRAGHLRVGL